MISALLVLLQIPTPVLPAGVNPELSAKVLAVEQKLDAGDFAAAKVSLDALPSTDIAYSWNDAAIPEDQRTSFAEARDQAIAMWTRAIPAAK